MAATSSESTATERAGFRKGLQKRARFITRAALRAASLQLQHPRLAVLVLAFEFLVGPQADPDVDEATRGEAEDKSGALLVSRRANVRPAAAPQQVG